jgi:Derlin-2/3
MVVYVWSKRNPHQALNILGIFTFTAPFLPWVLLGLGVLLGGGSSVYDDILGIAVGHVYYFWEDVYPTYRPGRRLLKTPNFM